MPKEMGPGANQMKENSTNLKSRAIHGLFWSALEKFGQLAVQVVITIVIARVLLPSDYGLVGMLSVFLAFASTFVESGFGTALIQDRDATDIEFSTVFYSNAAFGVLLYLLMYAAAPSIAVFYDQPVLVPLSRVMSLILITNSLGLIHSTILMKGIKFKILAKISLMSVVISGLAGIIMAYNGFGVWSLVFQSLINSITRSCLLWTLNRWKPAISFSVDAFKRLYAFGSKLLFSGLLFQIFDNIYAVIIGKTYDSSQLGLYAQAKNMSSIPIGTVTSIIQTVSFPILSTIQNEDQRLRDNYRRVIKLVVCVTFPLSLLLIVVAKPLTIVLLTEKWLPVVPLFQLMCLAGLFFPLTTINLNILNVKGRPDIFLVLEIIKKATIVVVLVFTARKGVMAIIMGQVLCNFIGSTLDLIYAGRIIDYPLKAQISDILPYFLAALAMAIVGFLVPPLLVQSYSLLLGVQVIFSILAFIVVCIMFKLDSFFELLAISKNILQTAKFV